MQLDEHTTDPVVYFGNGVKLYKAQPHSFSGNPDVVQHQRTVQQAQETYPVFDLIDRTAKAIGLTRPTIVSIFKNINDTKKAKIFSNPEGFASVFVKEIREQLANHVAEKIEYTPTQDLEQYHLDSLFPLQTDSDVERNFVQFRVQDDDKNGNVVCYFKFPANFKIRIPKIIGNYNPDWGIIRLASDGTSKVELVRETKCNMNANLLQFPNEKRKIDCAKKHFKTIGIKYRQVNDQIVKYWEEG